MAAVVLGVFAAAAVLIWVAFEGTGQNLGKTPIAGSRASTEPSEPKHPNLVGSPEQVASGSGWTLSVQHTDPGDFAMVMIAGEAQIVSYVQSPEELSGTRCGLAAVRVDDHFVWYGLVGPQIDELKIDLDNGTSSTSNKPVSLPSGYDTDYRAIVAELPAGTRAVNVTEIRSDGSTVSASDCHPSGRS